MQGKIHAWEKNNCTCPRIEFKKPYFFSEQCCINKKLDDNITISDAKKSGEKLLSNRISVTKLSELLKEIKHPAIKNNSLKSRKLY